MNFSKRQNEFCDIPGFGASKGEPGIVRALQKLWQKIQYLEHCRISEKKSTSEASSSSKDEDLTLTDVQYQLLLLQLKYVRGLLRENLKSNTEVFETKINKDEQICTSSTTDRNVTREDELYPDTTNKIASAKISNVDNSIAGLNRVKESSGLENVSKNAQVTNDSQFPRFRYSSEESTAAHQKTVPSSSKPHYHLNLDHLPFLLGASNTASHSVVANLQNIIAKMKQHNKALCGSKPNATRSADFIEKNSSGEKSKPSVAKSTFTNAPSTDFIKKNSSSEKLKNDITKSTFANVHSTGITEMNPTGENSEDVTKLMNELTRDLCALAAKQQKLVENIDASQIKKLGPELKPAGNAENDGTQNIKHVENAGSRTHRSYSDSEIKLYGKVKKMPKLKKNFIRHDVPPTQSASTTRSQSNNPSLKDRCELLRSLQKFKKNLTEEDISWD